jgi:hypothetical protein
VFVGLKLRHVQDVERVLRSQVRRLVAEEVPLAEAPAMWQALDGVERLATAAKTLLAERVEESRVWARAGDRSAAEYLARTSGSSVGVARSGLDTAKRLRRLPATEAAVRRGALSAQTEAIADAAAVNPGAEGSLLETAERSSLVELRQEANRAKAAGDPDPDATHRRIHRQRCLRRFTDAEGAWNLQARGTPDAGAAFNAALDPIIDEIFRSARRDERRESRDACAFDAVIELARRARDAAGASGTATPPGAAGESHRTASAPPTSSPRPTPPNPSFLALLRVDVDALVRGQVEGDELCDIAGVGAVPARVARDLLGDAILKLVITRGVDVVNVTNLGRGPTAAQRVALLWTSPWCTNSLCSHTLEIQCDHRKPWVAVHETTLDNLDRLCGPCHKRKTHEGWALVAGKGRRPLVPAGHPRHPDNHTTTRDDEGRSPRTRAQRARAPTLFGSDAA